MDVQKIFSHNLRRIREARAETRESFAEIIDISSNNLAKIENQERFASAPMIDKICSSLKISPSELFNDQDKKSLVKKSNVKEKLNILLNDMSEKHIKLIYDLSSRIMKDLRK